MPGRAEHRGHVDVHHPGRLVGVERFEATPGAGDAGVVHEQVDAAQPPERLDHELVDLGRRAHIGTPCPAAIAEIRRLGDVAHGDRGSVGQQRLGDRPADAGPTRGDDGAQPPEGEIERHGVRC